VPSIASQMPANTPDAVGRKIADLERTVRELSASAYLPTRSVRNNALSDPVVPNIARMSATTFPVGLAFTEVAGMDLVVPPGCTQLLALVTGFVGVVNPTATVDYLNVLVSVNTQASLAYTTLVPGSGYATASSGDAFTFTGLTPSNSTLGSVVPGSAVRLSVKAAMNTAAFAAAPGNHANVAAHLTWLK